ncbi:restriction endonuclease subunit S [Bacteroides ovatus]|uniref:restriction endonuclease subunit S n=1 Tax=Bacteroides ovatus TaxID=28116 RepID=UPI003566A5D4
MLSDFVERVKRKNKNNLCKLPLTISAQYGLVDQISFFNKVIASENMSNYYLLHKGDFAYNKSYSSEYPWGAIKRLDCYEQGTLSSLYICFKPYSHVSSDFLTHYFETSKWHQGISEIAVEGARNHGLLNVGIQDFFETRHCLPQSLLEQEKIAKFLNLIEERIATQNKIIEKLQSLIKGLAVALTTKEKANIAISQCLECHSSTLQESEVLSSGLCKVFGANGLVGYKDVPQMNGDAILVIKDGSGVGTVSYAQGKFSVIGTLNYLTVIGNNDLRYLYFALSVFNFQPYKTGMAIPHIYFKDYGKAKIYCPSLAEQKRVANVLDKLESKLFVEQELLASFNQQKLYLLGKMFI